MKINLVCVGSMHDDQLASLVDRYGRRIPFYMPFGITVVPDIKNGARMQPAQQKAVEGKAILEKIEAGDFVVLLDERGTEYTSRKFAEFIDRKAATLSRNLVFVIGGPYGFSEEVYSRANSQMCLSRMTFTHEMARALTCEQIYRAMTILRGEPYHHD